jgi:dolichol kinase
MGRAAAAAQRDLADVEAPEVEVPREPLPPERAEGAPGAGPGAGLKRELLRKRLHIATAVVPAAVWLLPATTAVLLLSAAVVAALIIEWARRRVPWVRYRFLRGTRVMLRGHERHGLAGATHMAVAYLLALLLFPQIVAVAAMLYNALGDAAAAVIGRRWGRHRMPWGKSWEGTAAALVVNLVIGMALPGIGVGAALLGALASSLVEFLPLPLDDNLRVTIGGGAALWAGISMA